MAQIWTNYGRCPDLAKCIRHPDMASAKLQIHHSPIIVSVQSLMLIRIKYVTKFLHEHENIETKIMKHFVGLDLALGF